MIRVRVMEEKDVDAVSRIEADTLTAWSAASLRQELEVEEGLCLVAETTGAGVVGWCACRRMRPEAELLKIAVADREKRKGIGSLLLKHLLAALQQSDVVTLFLEVRAKNTPARNFYHRHRFSQTGCRKGYYTDPSDDALILKRDV